MATRVPGSAKPAAVNGIHTVPLRVPPLKTSAKLSIRRRDLYVVTILDQ